MILGAAALGRGTTARHGTLSGMTTAVLFRAMTGRMGALLAVVPVAMIVSYGAAPWGVWRSDRGQRSIGKRVDGLLQRASGTKVTSSVGAFQRV